MITIHKERFARREPATELADLVTKLKTLGHQVEVVGGVWMLFDEAWHCDTRQEYQEVLDVCDGNLWDQISREDEKT